MKEENKDNKIEELVEEFDEKFAWLFDERIMFDTPAGVKFLNVEMTRQEFKSFLRQALQETEDRVREEIKNKIEGMRSSVWQPVGGLSNMEWLKKSQVLQALHQVAEQVAKGKRVKEIVEDWFSRAPKYRTKENLLQALKDTNQ